MARSVLIRKVTNSSARSEHDLRVTSQIGVRNFLSHFLVGSQLEMVLLELSESNTPICMSNQLNMSIVNCQSFSGDILCIVGLETPRAPPRIHNSGNAAYHEVDTYHDIVPQRKGISRDSKLN